MVNELKCWRQNHDEGFPHVNDFFNVNNQSTTSQIGHQHKPYPTYVSDMRHVTSLPSHLPRLLQFQVISAGNDLFMKFKV